MKSFAFKTIAISFITVFTFGCNVKQKEKKSVLDYVDTRVGTAVSIADITVTEVEEPIGYVTPIVGNPSALTHWTPQTALQTERVVTVPTAYWYEDDKIHGFRGTRCPNGSPAGGGDWGPVCIMPMTGKVKINANDRASVFSHDNEIAKPHYYSVYLDDYKVKTEFTAAAKTAFFQFTFPEAKTSSILFDGVFVPGNYKIIPERNEIEGYTTIAGHFRNHFVAKFDKKFETYEVDLLPEVVDAKWVPNGFHATYYNNDKFQGIPAVVTTHTQLHNDWLKEPVNGVNTDFFSVTYTADFIPRHTGEHRFALTTKDGTRMYVNDKMMIDAWGYRATGTNTFNMNMIKGEPYKLRIEYYDGSSSTEMHLRCIEPVKPNPQLRSQMALQGADGNAVYVRFATSEGEKVKVKVGISLLSFDQARANMNQEFPGFDFNKAVDKQANLWENELNLIRVEGNEEDKSIFYTGLNRCFVHPRSLNENGKYFSPYDFQIHEGEMYSALSLWDTFRSLHPLWVILKPNETTRIINGLLNAYREGGWMPKWPNPGYRNIMMGTHADAVIADAYVKGIRGFDVELAFEAMLKNANQKGDRGFEGRVGIEHYNKLGYVPSDIFSMYGESVARTLEFAYDDYCIAQMALAMSKQDYYQDFMERSKRYINVFDEETGLVRGKKINGEWLAPFDKTISIWAIGSEEDTKNYYYNHTLLVPHDISGLSEFKGGDKQLIRFLDDFFDKDMYYVGDEFSMHAPYIYNSIGAPWKTQKEVREILAKYFFNDPGGLPGNEDCGQLSSWYVFGAMGFYPACPGDPIYQLCSPIFNKIEINVGEGKTFSIITRNNTKKNVYIQSATLNGIPYNKSWIHHNDIISGSTLEFEMGPEPNKAWGSALEDRYPSISNSFR